jgi:hypothetical protein
LRRQRLDRRRDLPKLPAARLSAGVGRPATRNPHTNVLWLFENSRGCHYI